MEARRLDQFEHRQAGGHRNRVAAERTGLVDRPARCDLLHQFTAAAVGAHRHAAADDLAEGRQVGRDAIARLRAAERDAERSEEHTSELQSLMRISYAVFCLKKKKRSNTIYITPQSNNGRTKTKKRQ